MNKLNLQNIYKPLLLIGQATILTKPEPINTSLIKKLKTELQLPKLYKKSYRQGILLISKLNLELSIKHNIFCCELYFKTEHYLTIANNTKTIKLELANQKEFSLERITEEILNF